MSGKEDWENQVDNYLPAYLLTSKAKENIRFFSEVNQGLERAAPIIFREPSKQKQKLVEQG